MKATLKNPCKECPYLAKTKGWLGGHETAMDFHDFANNDTRMACHKTIAEDGNTEKANQCAGQILYMNAIFKRSKHPDTVSAQNRLADYVDKDELLNSLDGSKIVEFHGK